MATEVLQAASVGDYDAWLLEAGASKVVAINSPDDDATTSIMTSTDNNRQSFSLVASAIPTGSTINSVSVTCRLGQTWDDGGLSSSLRLAGSNLDGPAHPMPGGSWVTYTDTIARPGGGSWSLADLATLQVGVLALTLGGSWVHVTTLFITVDYTEGAGGATGNMLLMFA